MENKKQSFAECEAAIQQICSGLDLPENELQSRARLLYLMNRLNFWEDMPVLLAELIYQRDKNNLCNLQTNQK